MNQIERLAREFNSLKREVRGLSGGPQLAYSSVEDGAIDVNGPDGELVSQIGTQFDGSHGVGVFTGPIPPTLSTPILIPGPESITVRWDGYFVNGLGDIDISITPTMDWSRAEVHVSTDPEFEAETADTLVSTFETPRGGEVTVPLPAGVAHYVRFVGRSLSGRSSVASPVASAIPLPAPLTDLQPIIDQIWEDVSQAQLDAATASEAAGNAETAASNAAQAAADAAGLVDGKANVLIQSATPAVDMQKQTTLWIDTTGGANTPKRWLIDKWVAVTDKTATDAAAAAVTAKNRADDAFLKAEGALTAAGNAQTSANGKNNVYYVASLPGGSGFTTGDTAFIREAIGKPITGQYTWVGPPDANPGWKQTTLSHQVIASVDLGKATVGELDGVFVKAQTLTVDKLIVSSGTQLIPDRNFKLQGNSEGWTIPANMTFDEENGKNGGGSVLISATASQTGTYWADNSAAAVRRIPVSPGSSYRFSAWFRSSVAIPARSVSVYIKAWNNSTGTSIFCPTTLTATSDLGTTTRYDGKATAANTWVEVGGLFTIPDGYTHASPGVFKQTNLTTGALRISDPNMEQAFDGRLVVDGALDALTITGPTLRANDSVTTKGGWIHDAAGMRLYKPGSASPTFNAKTASGDVDLTGTVNQSYKVGTTNIDTLLGKFTRTVGPTPYTVAGLRWQNAGSSKTYPASIYSADGNDVWVYNGTSDPNQGMAYMGLGSSGSAYLFGHQEAYVTGRSGATFASTFGGVSVEAASELSLSGGSGTADLLFGNDGKGRVWSMAIYNRVYAGTSAGQAGTRPMVITSAGTLGSQTGTFSIDDIPYRMASGSISVSPKADETTSAVVTFPSGRFTATPDVVVTPNSSVVGSTVKGAGVSTASKTQCTVWLHRTNTTTTSVNWIAMQ